MTGIDIVILVAIVISGILSWLRGFVREAVSLITWFLAIAITFLYSHKFAVVVPEAVGGTATRVVVAALVLFFGTLLFGWLFSTLLKRFLSTVNLSAVDRILGLLFGLTRGIAIISVVVLLLNLTTIPKESWWANSFFLPRFQHLAAEIHDRLPQELASYFDFSST